MNDHNNYTDSSFDLYQAYTYVLLLQIGTTTFNYAVVYKNRLIASAENYDLKELTEPNELIDLLSATYKKVIIGVPASGLTLVPKSIFDEDHIAEFAGLLDVKDNEKVFVQALDAQNNIVYKATEALVSAVERFDLQNVYYTAEGWIKAIKKSNPPENNLYLNIDKNTLQVLYFLSGNIKFYNTFEFENEDDLAYYTSVVCDELQLKPEYTTLVLSGNIDAEDKNKQRLADFYPNIEFNNLEVSELPAQITRHKLLALAALSLCGSSEAV
jgi:hypothetical protein